MKTSHSFASKAKKGALPALCLALAMSVSDSAFAQFTQATTMLTTVSSWMTSVGVIIVTIALMFVGARMVFQAAQWKDVAPVFWGGVLIGGASTVAGLII